MSYYSNPNMNLTHAVVVCCSSYFIYDIIKFVLLFIIELSFD